MRQIGTSSQVGAAAQSARVAVLIVALAFVTELAVSSEQRSGAETSDFRIVSGDGYEGAIVPASSAYYGMFVIAIGSGADAKTLGLTPWTPEPSDVAATERYLAGWVERAAKVPSQILATVPAEDR